MYLVVYSNFDPRMKQPNLSIFSLKFLCRAKMVNCIKNRDV